MYRILPKDTQALLIDMQEKLIPHIDNYEVIIKNAKILIQGLSALNIPLIINEQYPKVWEIQYQISKMYLIKT